MNKQTAGLLSLCKKAGLLVSGEFSCESALRDKTARLVIVAEDASNNTKKKFVNKAFYYNVPCLLYGDKASLSNAVGKQNRAVLAVADEGFGLKIQQLIEAQTGAQQAGPRMQ